MAVAINRAGVTTVSVEFGGTGGLEELGKAEDQIDRSDSPFYQDVPGDANGGPAGPPIDFQFMGRTTRIRCQMSTYDRTVAAKVEARIASGNAGAVADANVGKLLFQDTESVRVLLNNASDPRNYVQCRVIDAVEVGLGTKYSTLICEFEAHRNSSGTIFDTNAS